MTEITVTVDGVSYTDDVEPRLLLVHYLRERLGKTGTPVGCDTSNCGACTVHLNGESVKSCSVLAVQADGATIIQWPGNGGANQQWRFEGVAPDTYRIVSVNSSDAMFLRVEIRLMIE